MMFDDRERTWPEIVAGVDEAGRGPLAGPVVVGAVVLPRGTTIANLRDSKRLSARQRALLVPLITDCALAWAVGMASVEEIDRLNILAATLLAMQRAVAALHVRPELVVVDGTSAPRFACPAVTIIGGDDKVLAISAASVLAKEFRDQLMREYDHVFPGYEFTRHKGYGTPAHVAALISLGPCAIHRKSFAPVRDAGCTAGATSGELPL